MLFCSFPPVFPGRMENSMNNKKRISILGDSVSTYYGLTPEGYVFYGSWNAGETGVESPEDTWWMKVIRAMDGELGRNNSLSGCLVAGRALSSGTSLNRIRDLSVNGRPDMILVALGANDWGFSVLPKEFASEYARMLYLLKETYPYADIWCATLPEGRAPDDEYFFFDVDSCISKRVYSDIIRKAAAESGVHVADLYRSGQEYSSIDGVHPDKKGMQMLADLWIRELKK